jgi:periplasmic divalent cation tolerance protein
MFPGTCQKGDPTTRPPFRTPTRTPTSLFVVLPTADRRTYSRNQLSAPGRLRGDGLRLGGMSGYLQVSTATATRDEAVQLAGSIVSAGLAAGAQIVGPVVSVFWHEGQYGEGEEWQVLLKTTERRYAELETHLLNNHPWDNPEVSAVPITSGSAAYLDWLDHTTKG